MLERETLQEFVPVAKIFMDQSYGRPVKAVHVAKLAKEWDDAKAGAIYLSLRDDGQMACLDGWHRVLACREAKGSKATLPARVYIDLTVQEEAALFTAFNRDRRGLRPTEIFVARLAAKDLQAQAINDVLNRLGVSVSHSSGPNNLQAIRAVEQVYEMGAEDLLKEDLSLLISAWGHHSQTYNNLAIMGMAAFLVRYPYADKGRVVAVLQRLTPVSMLARASAAGALFNRPRANTSLWGRALWLEYNNRLTERNRLPEWQDNVASPGRKETASPARAKAAKARRAKAA